MKKLYLFLVISISLMTVSLSSCVTDEPAFTSLIGTWELNYNQNGPINPNSQSIDKFAFYSNGEGSYGWWDSYGYWKTVQFRWVSMNNNYLQITYPDQVTSCYYRYVNGYLEFSETSSFYRYTGYRPVYN